MNQNQAEAAAAKLQADGLEATAVKRGGNKWVVECPAYGRQAFHSARAVDRFLGRAKVKKEREEHRKAHGRPSQPGQPEGGQP